MVTIQMFYDLKALESDTIFLKDQYVKNNSKE